MRPTLIFYKQPEVSIPLLLDKTFSWQKLIAPVFAHNMFAHDEFPNLWKFVKSSQIEKNSSLSYRPNEAEKKKFAIELQNLIAVVFKLNLETLIEHVQTHGPFIKGYLEMRTNLLSLVPDATSNSWNLTFLGKTPFLIHEVPGQKPSEYLIPIVAGKGRVLRVHFDSTKSKVTTGTLAKGEIWSKANWEVAESNGTYTLVNFIDTVAKLANPSTFTEGIQKVETVYGTFFEMSAQVVSLAQEDLKRSSVQQAIENGVKVLNQVVTYHQKSNVELNVQDLDKLIRKLIEIQGQLQSGNKTFFGVSTKIEKPGKRLK